jgi:hypothetical protein
MMIHVLTTNLQFAVCIQNTAYTASLEVRKIYQIVPDADATRQRLTRVIDESGEDYLYPADYFLSVDLPQAVKEALLQAA